MKVAFHTLTGQTARFIDKLDIAQDDKVLLTPHGQTPQCHDKFVLIIPTYNDNFDYVEDFIADNLAYCHGIIGIGNRNFGSDFCREARELSQTYHLPLLYELEFSGTSIDTNIVKGILSNES
ncbi:class Ib ribonucleoside-diphosphate reductase assembly flavoprotein NrdI [Streptococcus jiangjianxini]|uniref:class Ib ribonucleoside-diphosphate reductase assembly flavoprotein NrdI n=1 Tax=Streptococcus jiangjianxini TaxID=3161189 RepID=UPI0032EB5421